MKLPARTLVIAAHPDDEVLGCGATMARIATEGGIVQTIFLADGESSRFSQSEIKSQLVANKINARKAAANSAALILGSLPPKFFDLPDNRLDTIPRLDIIKIIENEIHEFQPFRVITHYSGDLNIDHQLIYEAVAVATRPQGEDVVKEILSFEVPSSTEWRTSESAQTFCPNLFVEAKKYLNQKLAALNAYELELREFPHPRSEEAVISLMKWRGSNSSLQLAEAFLLTRGVY